MVGIIDGRGWNGRPNGLSGPSVWMAWYPAMGGIVARHGRNGRSEWAEWSPGVGGTGPRQLRNGCSICAELSCGIGGIGRNGRSASKEDSPGTRRNDLFEWAEWPLGMGGTVARIFAEWLLGMGGMVAWTGAFDL